jgi:dihydroorotate dehydrogenase
VSLYSALARPVFFALDAERAHDLTMAALQTPVAPALLALVAPPIDARLNQRAFGLTFRNPIGLAAGLDKQGIAAPSWAALGFGFAEIGTVTPRPQPGNPKPRLFRLRGDRAIINRFGFNSAGAEIVAKNLSTSRSDHKGPTRREGPASRDCRVGINIGKNKETANEQAVDDYLRTVDVLHAFADYFVINVSSPNTVGLRSLQEAESLRPLVQQVVDRVAQSAQRPIPVLVKVSPDMADDELLASVDAAIAGGVAGIIATNTTTARSQLRSTPAVAAESGGLSGAPLCARANEVCRTLFRHVRDRVPIVGVGGIFSADDAYQRMRAGASLVQVYTGLIYEGPAIVKQIAAGLIYRLERDGFTNVSQAVGIDAD